jgi:hypothetical protein
VPSLRWLRRIACSPMVADVPGVGQKPLRDCTDEEVQAIAKHYSQFGSTEMFDEDWWLRQALEAREEARNPLEGVGFFPLLGLAWSHLLLEAARRSSVVRWLFRLRGRIEDRLRPDDDDDDWGVEGDEIGPSGSSQIAFGGLVRPEP